MKASLGICPGNLHLCPGKLDLIIIKARELTLETPKIHWPDCHENFCPLEKICPRTNFRVNSPATNCLRMRISVLQCSFGLFKACFCPTMEFHTSYDIIACCSVYSVSILLSSMHKDEDLIEQAYLYLTKKYPEECTASRKR